ncbi:hypothetical protein NEOLEDRAFT_1157187 [Neolentinus lepideus HHB14362 ss-1]|uniref:RING-type domain-containing protein n=1 Tax=Neolentinus lepideus HHB14362 ss-1 TaxID=1314782 RepID=A0A165RDJ4_9AGAM|nr:hypothetical protein NEOLEDRAFT_1157187 [Neolentinus lepideus HHB14362 ss-1]
MASIATWYHSQYAAWNRTRRLQATPFVARPETTASRTATAMAQGRVDVAALPYLQTSNGEEKKNSDTLFGPSIGIVSNGPGWTEQMKTHRAAEDELTPEVIKGWIEKSKQSSQPTTTLQALVNLKRPTIRLTPFKDESSENPNDDDSDHHHGLEFEYDCDSAKCGIYVYVVVPSDHPLATESSEGGYSHVLIFETVTEGGFAKFLVHDHGASLELGRIENGGAEQEPAPEASTVSGAEVSATLSSDVQGQGQSEATAFLAAEADSAQARSSERKKRFSTFPFRKRHGNEHSIAGPALAVVDAQPAAPIVPGTPGADQRENKEFAHSSEDGENEGVKVAIKLVALDEQGKELKVANEQVTYLHIVRFGQPPVKVEDTTPEEDKRPWVVRVVKREATIGSHAFHLHEIYGLSSYSSTPSQPPAPTASPTTHTYPPVSNPATHEEEPSSECLVCLSSPREVVLLPCRHLVACKECAINMIEFGAGGTIVHSDPNDAATGGNANGVGGSGDTNGGTGGENGGPANSASEAAAMQPAPRRKRKAKGWFCPVCRQPYTSLLRITTTPPSTAKDMEKRASTSTDGTESPTENIPSVPAALAPSTAPASRGPLGSITTPAFLRNMSFRGTPTLPPDLERGQGPQVVATPRVI